MSATILELSKADPIRDKLTEVGYSGLRAYGGILDEEFLRELRGQNGTKIFHEMSKNDAVVGASLFAYTTLAKQVTFRIEPKDQSDQAACEIADFVRGALFEDMNLSWNDALSEIFSFLPYGWSFFEVVMKYRGGDVEDPTKKSRFNDNKLGWRKWAIRAQDSLVKWNVDEHGGVNGMVQRSPTSFAEIEIPIQKSLLFRTGMEKGSPEGVSILRAAYTPWYHKRRLQIIRGIGIERDLAGLPVLTPPQNVDLWNTNDSRAVMMKSNAERIVRNIRRDEHEGIIKPFGWTLELLATSGSRQFDITDVIGQLNAEIAMSMMTDFLLVGHEKIGARSVAAEKRSTFALAASSFLDSICDVVNRFAIPQLLKVNGWDTNLSPKLEHGPVAEIELNELASFIEKMANAGLLFPDQGLEQHLRTRAMLPAAPAVREEKLEMDTKQPQEGEEGADLVETEES